MKTQDCKHDTLVRLLGPIKVDKRSRIGKHIYGTMKYECKDCGLVFKFKLQVVTSK